MPEWYRGQNYPRAEDIPIYKIPAEEINDPHRGARNPRVDMSVDLVDSMTNPQQRTGPIEERWRRAIAPVHTAMRNMDYQTWRRYVELLFPLVPERLPTFVDLEHAANQPAEQPLIEDDESEVEEPPQKLRKTHNTRTGGRGRGARGERGARGGKGKDPPPYPKELWYVWWRIGAAVARLTVCILHYTPAFLLWLMA